MKFRLIIFTLLVSITLVAQTAVNGEALFNNKQYTKAKKVYEELLKQRPNLALYNYRLGQICYELKDYETSIKHFEMAGTKFPLRDLFLAELYFITYQFDKSALTYQKYSSTLKPDDVNLAEYERKIKLAENAARLLNKVEDIAIIDSVVVNKADFLNYYNIKSELGTITQEPLKLNSNELVDKIKFSTQRKDRIYFSDSINGQLDIFTSYKLLDEWSKPLSLSKVINSSKNENYPFLSLDGITLYFASEGHSSIGGYDIFVTRYNSSTNSYLPPENIGMPFNSPANDYMMVIDEQHKVGWFATDRNQTNEQLVIYTFVTNELKKIIRSEDTDMLRRAAQLKKYRKSTNKISSSTSVLQNQLEKTDNKIHFIVNDTVIYSNISDFKSEETQILWNEFYNIFTDLNNKKTELNNLRELYFNSNNQNKDSLGSSIIELEKNCLEISNTISSRTIQLRNLENKYLQNQK